MDVYRHFYDTVVLLLPFLATVFGIGSSRPRYISSCEDLVGINRHRIHPGLFMVLNRSTSSKALHTGFDVYVSDRATSSISLHWNISGSMYAENSQSTSSVNGFVAELYAEGIRELSPLLPADTNDYSFSGLHSNSKYRVCVHICHNKQLLSKQGKPLKDESSCFDVHTIPLMRADSIAALTITLAYLLLVTSLGVIQWRRTKANFKRRRDSEVDLREEVPAVSWRVIEERERLTAHSAIEDNY